MKKFINILVAAAVTALAVVSCQKAEQVKPGTPDPEGCYGVYFPVQEATGSHTYDPEMDRSITFTVARTNTSGAITVPYTVKTDSEGVFEFEDIVFADGQAETEFEVTFDAIEEGKNSSFSIQLSDDNAYVSHYNTGAIAIDFSVIVVKWEDFLDPKTGEPAVFTINSRWDGMFGPITATLKYYEVGGIRTGVFTSLDIDAESGETQGFWHSVPSVTLNIRWYTENQNSAGYDFVELPKQYFGYDYNGGDWLAVPLADAADPIFVYDYPWYWVERGYNWGADGMGDNWLDEANKTGQMDGSYPVGYYDGNGGFFFNIYFYIPGLGGWSPDGYGTVAIASGFTRVDYSLDVESDFPDEGVTPVLFTVGADVAKVDYALYEGSLNSVQVQARVEAIAEGKEENVLTVSEFAFDEDDEIYYAELGVSPETTGEYTLVAVAFNKTTEEITESTAQTFQSLSFFHVAAADDADYDVEVSVFTEDTPARYKELHKYDSFAYGVSGKDLKEVHVAFYTSDLLEKYGLATLVADAKADEDGDYIVSADVLDEINADGGYYTVATGMKPKTTYIVVVWATNGSKEAYVADLYTTEKLPYVWNSLGKGTLTDGFFTALFPNKADYTVACDVYEEGNTPGLYMVTGFQCALAAAFFGITEEQMAPYEDGNWRNAEIVVDATDPEAVFIEEQDYGVLVNTSYGFFMIETEASGTLKDGVISWPAEEMYVGMPALGKWYYANKNGTFNITLPTAADPTAAAPAVFSNGQVKDEAVSSSATLYNKPVVRYEREVKSISVETKAVTYNREKKENKQTSTIAGKALSTR